MTLSVVTKTSNSFSATSSSSPFFIPAQPRSGTIATSCSSSKARFRRRSTFSSSRTRKVGGLEGHLQVGFGHLAAHAREAFEEVVEGVASLYVVHEGLCGHARAGKDELTVHHVGIARDHRVVVGDHKCSFRSPRLYKIASPI